jgi:hypothetical protein
LILRASRIGSLKLSRTRRSSDTFGGIFYNEGQRRANLMEKPDIHEKSELIKLAIRLKIIEV